MKDLRDLCLREMANLEYFVMEESDRQVKKWGIQKRHAFEWLAYLVEEMGELSQAISEAEYREGPIPEITKEAIHVATLALKIAEMTRFQE